MDQTRVKLLFLCYCTRSVKWSERNSWCSVDKKGEHEQVRAQQSWKISRIGVGNLSESFLISLGACHGDHAGREYLRYRNGIYFVLSRRYQYNSLNWAVLPLCWQCYSILLERSPPAPELLVLKKDSFLNTSIMMCCWIYTGIKLTGTAGQALLSSSK